MLPTLLLFINLIASRTEEWCSKLKMFLVITLSKDGFLSVVFKNALAKSDVVMIPTRLFCSYTSNLVLVEIIFFAASSIGVLGDTLVNFLSIIFRSSLSGISPKRYR